MNKISFFILLLIVGSSSSAEFMSQKHFDSFCHAKKLRPIDSFSFPKVDGMDEWKFEKRECGQGEEKTDCFFINVFHDKKKIHSFKDPFGMMSCSCEDQKEDRYVMCDLGFTPFQLTSNKKALLVKGGQYGEAGVYNYRLYLFEKGKLNLLWEEDFGTGEIISLDNSRLEIRDMDKNSRQEIYYTAIGPYSSSHYGDQSTDSYKVTNIEYDLKKKKMVKKNPNFVWAVRVGEFKTQKLAHKFHGEFSCDNEKFYIFERENIFKKLSSHPRAVVAIKHTEKEAKALAASLRKCNKKLRPKIVKLQM